ncbi:hypothetical protein [Marinobacter salarius]|uniref:hypothetical protein n=1 Tax=Marinobacter salarius TaxID=1420917 RepID=UPI0025A36C40|nr:hypothetical protein [Marinobacter salarius]MDM8181255.1 hypothetical protein [Marinobacter salarius]|tara:strand:+ start:163 stop:486 length:324 start_codon:yes stop_codon:yes gene_type:complete
MFKMNKNRCYQYPVSVTIFDGEKEQTGRFTATFKVMPNSALRDESNADKRLLDLVLVNVEGVEVPGDDGKPLQGEALVETLKDDPSVSAAMVAAYQESITKKNRPRT